MTTNAPSTLPNNRIQSDNGLIKISNTLIGVIYGLLAALLYASVIIINKFMKPIPSIDKTVMQLLFSVVILIPYILIGQEFKGMIINLEIILL